MTLPPNPSQKLENAPFTDLMRVLLSQFKRLLADNDVLLTVDETLAVSRAIAGYSSHPKLSHIRKMMRQLVEESLNLIKDRWGLSFRQSLSSDLNDIGQWNTTAEFLEIANEKSNAELRISAGASLLVAMGESSFAPLLIDVIQHDNGVMDVDAVFAKRALLHVSRIDGSAEDWMNQVEKWIQEQ